MAAAQGGGPPLELLVPQRSGLDLYTANGEVIPAPQPQLPEGKASVFDGFAPAPLSPKVEALGPPDAWEQVAGLAGRLLPEMEPLDFLTFAMLFLALALGLFDTRRRWLGYATSAVSWSLHQLTPGALMPSRVVPSGPLDVEVARTSHVATRRFIDFLWQAKARDELRAEAAVDEASRADPRLTQLLDVVRGILPTWPAGENVSLDGVWECECDYFTSGVLANVTVTIDGSVGRYLVEGVTGMDHRLSDISLRVEGNHGVVSFRWANSAGSAGSGEWRLSVSGDCIDGCWRQDGGDGGPWAWRGTRRPSIDFLTSTAPPPKSKKAATPPEERARSADAAVLALRSLVDAAVHEPMESREALACAWDAAAPDPRGGAFSKTAQLTNRWLELGAELRLELGLTEETLIAVGTRQLAFGLSATVFASFMFVTARLLAIGLGSHNDAATWALFTLIFSLVLDWSVLARREALRQLLRSPAERELRSSRLEALAAWADAGALLRSGSAPREKVLDLVRRGVPSLRTAGSGEKAPPSDSQVEEFLRIWHPALRRRVRRRIGEDISRPNWSRQKEQQEKGEELRLVDVFFENLSIPEGRPDIWR